MSQFDDRDGRQSTLLKDTLRTLANSDLSDEAILLVISQLGNQPKKPQNNGQFGDH